MLRQLVRAMGLRTRWMLVVIAAAALLAGVAALLRPWLGPMPAADGGAWLLALAVGQGLVLLLVVGAALEGLVLRPLARVLATAERLSRGDLRAPPGDPPQWDAGPWSALIRHLAQLAASLAQQAQTAHLSGVQQLLAAVRRVGSHHASEPQLLQELCAALVATGRYAEVWLHAPGAAVLDQPLARCAARPGEPMPAAPLQAEIAVDGEALAQIFAVPAAAQAADPREAAVLQQVAQESAALLEAWRSRQRRQQAEADLLASAAQLREAERIGKMGSWSYDLATQRVSGSDELFAIVGTTPEEFGGTLDDLLDFVHRDDRPTVVARFREALAQRRTYDLQHRMVDRSGAVKTVHARAEFRCDAAGVPIAADGMMRDVSAEVGARAELHERMKELRLLLQVSHLTSQSDLPVPDLLTLVAQLLPQAYQFNTMASACVLLGDTVYDSGGFAPSQWMQRADFMVGDQPGRICVAYAHDPGPFPDGAFLREERELIDTVAAQLGDTLTRRVEEDRLRERELMYSSIFSQARDAMAVLEPVSGRFLEYNHSAHARLGYTRREFAGLRNSDFEIDAAGQPLQRDLRHWLHAEGHAFDARFRHRDGRILDVYVRLWPLQLKGQAVLAAVWTDQTEERRIAKELENYQQHLEDLVRSRTAALAEARARAESANVAKSAFLANMSHEIRTPLNAIIGLNHLLQRTVHEPDQAERLKKIEAAAQHLLGIVNDILDLSKVEAGRMALDPADFALTEVLQRVADAVRLRADEKGLTLAMRVDPGVPPRVHGDALRLSQVLLNLAQNAVKFTEQGSVELHVALGPPATTALRFEVIDTGIGIAPHQKAKLFQPFEQADSSTTRRFGGTGLGLAISARLVALMGGEIGVDSALHQGSCFWFELPLPAATRESVAIEIRPARRSPSDLLRKPSEVRILLVEDDPLNQEVANELLQSAGYRVDLANDGQQALQMAAAARYDLVLMDLQMPVMDGFAATRALRGRSDYEQVPILAMTASVLAEDRALSDAAGMDDFVAKPVEPAKFYATVAHWTGTQAPTAAAPVRGSNASAAALVALQGLAELDVSLGLRSVSGRADRYISLLQRFVEDRAGDSDALSAALTSGRNTEAQLLAHSLKGVAGALGAQPLQAEAAHVEALLRDAKASLADRAEACARLSRAHLALLAALRRALPPPAKPTAPTSVDMAQARQALVELKQLLGQDDVAALDLLRRQRGLLSAALGSSLGHVEKLVGAFAFDEALEAIQRADSDLHAV